MDNRPQKVWPVLELVNSESIRRILDEEDDEDENTGRSSSQSGSVDMFASTDDEEKEIPDLAFGHGPSIRSGSVDLFADTDDDENNETHDPIISHFTSNNSAIHFKSLPSLEMDISEQFSEIDDIMVSSDSEVSDDCGTSTVRNHSKRPKTDIWKKFLTKKDKNNKIISNQCLQCLKKVSPKADRMRKHVCKISKHLKKHQKKVLEPHQSVLPFTSPQINNSSTLFSPKKQASITKYTSVINTQKKKQLDKQLGRFIFSTDVSFNLVQSQEFSKFVKLLNPAYTPPSRTTIGNSILEEVSTDVSSEMKSHLNGQNVSILQDGWSTNKNAAVITHCITTASKSYFLLAENSGTAKKTAEYCFQLLEEAMVKAREEFKCNVVGVVTDNCSTMQALHKLVVEKYDNLYVFGCHSHLFNLIGSYFTPEDIKLKISSVQSYMRAHQFTAAALDAAGAKRPVLPGTTRWNSQIDSFLNYCENHAKYLEVAQNYDVGMNKSAKKKLASVLSILNDSVIYDRVKDIIQILKPICLALDKLQGERTNIADATDCWLNLRQELPEHIINDDYYKKQETLGLTDVGIAAYILHPKFKGKNLPDNLAERGLELIGRNNNLNVIVVSEMSRQRSSYFLSPFMKKDVCSEMEPGAWWKAAATSIVPEELKLLVSQVFVLPSSTGSIERSFSTLGNIMSKQRNRLSIDKASKLCRVHNFLKLKQDEINEMQGFKSRNPKKRQFGEMEHKDPRDSIPLFS